MSGPIASEVREAYQYGVGELPAYHSKEYGHAWRERGEQFDTWLAEHDREVTERTLLDAADAMLADHPDPETCNAVFDPWDVDEFLRARITPRDKFTTKETS